MLHFLIETHESLGSTQEHLKSLANTGVLEGTVVQASLQTAGKGRHGREWVSNYGNLYFSFLLRPHLAPGDIGTIALTLGVAVAQTLQDFTKDPVTLKWPNDILLNGKKCAGILLESEIGEYVVAGVGVNIANAPEEGACLGEEININNVRDKILENFANLYGQEFTQNIKPLWLDLAHPIGTQITVKLGEEHITGSFEGIDDQGNMMIDGRKISSGDVFLT